MLTGRPGLGAGTSYSAHRNKGAHVPLSKQGSRQPDYACTVDNLPWEDQEKKSPIIGIFEPKLFFLFLSVLLAVQKPLQRAPLMLLQRKTPIVRPPWKRAEAPNLN